MDLRSIAWTSRKLAFCSLLAACAAAGGCIEHVFIGGEGGDTGRGGTGATGPGGGGGGSGSGEGGRAGDGGSGGVSSGSGGSGGGEGLLCQYHGTPCGGDVLVDLWVNPHHCGACGHDCGPNAGCAEGQCVSLQGECNTCASAITSGSNVPEAPICQPLSQQIYDALIDCACGSVCGAVCGDNVCACVEATDECLACVSGAQGSCLSQFNACANDI